MIEDEKFTIFLAGFGGFLLGAVFFWGLWWTVRKGVSVKQPALWFLGSMIARLGIVLAGFYWIGAGQWPRLLSCLVGFLVARMIAVKLPQSWSEPTYLRAKDSDHAT